MASSPELLPCLHPDKSALLRGLVDDYKQRHHDRASTIANIVRTSEATCRELGVEDPDRSLIIPYIEEIYAFDEEERKGAKCAFSFVQNSDKSSVTPLHCRVRDYIDTYTSGLTEALCSVSLSFGAPTFPYDQWKNILRDVYVDFDRIYGYDMGLERQVCSASEWNSAFMDYEAAMLFAFPGREAELQVYRRHILKLFWRYQECFHGRILAYDRAVRKFVGGRRDVLFNEIGKFNSIRVAYLRESGVVFDLSDSGTSRSPKRMRIEL